MRKNIIFFLILFVISIFLVFVSQDIPRGLAHDENELARTAFSLENKPYTPFTSVADGHGTPYFYVLLKSFQTFGVDIFALRLPNRIFGIFSVLIFYGILKTVFRDKKWGDWLAFLFSIILLTSRWYLHFVRFAFEMPFLLFLELSSLYGILLWQQKKKPVFLIMSGIFAGLAFNSYQPGRIFFLVPLFVLFLNKPVWKSFMIYLITFVILIIPISSYLINNPQNDIRINQQLFLKSTELTLDNKISYLASNIVNTVSMFFWNGDMNGRHNYPGKPAINPILFIFFLLGLIYSLIKIKNKFTYIFLFYLILSIAPTILTYPWENPNMLRTYTSLPAIVFFAGQGTIFILKLFQSLKFKTVPKKQANKTGLFLVLALIVFSSIYEMRTYFKYQPLVFRQSFDKPDYLKIIRQNALELDN